MVSLTFSDTLILSRLLITVKDLTNGQHTKTRQHHNSTKTTTSGYNFMLFHAFKMAVSIASLRVNASD